MKNPFQRAPMPSIKTEITKLEEAERKFEPVKKALLEEVKKASIVGAERTANQSSWTEKDREKFDLVRHIVDIDKAEAVEGIILGKENGYKTERFNLGLRGHYADGTGYHTAGIFPDETDEIFDNLVVQYGDIVNEFKIKMGTEVAQKELDAIAKQMKGPLDAERQKRLETRKTTIGTFLKNLK